MSATVTQEKPRRGLGDRVFAGTALAAGISIMLALAGVFVFLFIEGYQVDRIRAWLDPWADPSGIGFHSIQGYLALALGGVTGAGLGESRLAGGLFLQFWPDLAATVSRNLVIPVFGALLVLSTQLMPGGVAGIVEALAGRLRRRR